MQRLIGGMLILALVPGLGLAQSAKDSWDNLKLLQPGQRIEVVDTSDEVAPGSLRFGF